jgi:hypothetical protein
MVGGRGNNSISKAEGFLFCCLEVDDEGDDAVVVRKTRGLLAKLASWAYGVLKVPDRLSLTRIAER